MKQKAPRHRFPPRVQFANVDLVVEAKFDLSILLAALAPRTFILFADVSPRKSSIRAELNGLTRDAESAILALALIAKRLPRPARKIWNRATCAFDVGFFGGFEPRWAVQSIGPRALRAASSVGASILMTAYATHKSAARRHSTKKKAARSARRQ